METQYLLEKNNSPSTLKKTIAILNANHLKNEWVNFRFDSGAKGLS